MIVASEIGQLQQVVLHRPGREFTRLSPSNKEHLLFDDVLWLRRAQEEHDRFAHTLKAAGAQVHLVLDLLAQALEQPGAREFALDNTFRPRFVDARIAAALREYASSLSAPDLAEHLIAGVTTGEYTELTGQELPADVTVTGGMVLPCLPNHLFTRDASAWIYGGVELARMRMPARQRETVNLDTIYSFHPLFAGQEIPRWNRDLDIDRPVGPGGEEIGEQLTIEGGDICVIGNGALLVGVSERTSLEGVAGLAQRLFAAGAAQNVIAVQLPVARAYMHLDTVWTMVDRATFVAYQGLGQVPTVTFTPGANGQVERHCDDGPGMYDAIAKALGVDAIDVLVNPADELTSERDQWNDACNLLAVSPGHVLAYDRNEAANDFLRSRGLRVTEVAGAELGRGRGGPRCMSCPIDRAAI